MIIQDFSILIIFCHRNNITIAIQDFGNMICLKQKFGKVFEYRRFTVVKYLVIKKTTTIYRRI